MSEISVTIGVDEGVAVFPHIVLVPDPPEVNVYTFVGVRWLERHSWDLEKVKEAISLLYNVNEWRTERDPALRGTRMLGTIKICKVEGWKPSLVGSAGDLG